MNFIEYMVRVFSNEDKFWHLNNKLHREDGPAIECANGEKHWFLNDEELSEGEFNRRMSSYEGKVVEIDGKRYQLVEVSK